MKVIQLPDVLYDYLVHVVEKHAGSGIHPEEGTAVSHLWEAVTKRAQHFDDQQVRAAAAAASPQAQSPVDPPLAGIPTGDDLGVQEQAYDPKATNPNG